MNITLEKTYTINLGDIELEYTPTYNIDCEYKINDLSEPKSVIVLNFKTIPLIIKQLITTSNYKQIFNCIINDKKHTNCAIHSLHSFVDKIEIIILSNI